MIEPYKERTVGASEAQACRGATPEDNQLMTKNEVFSLEPPARLEAIEDNAQ